MESLERRENPSSVTTVVGTPWVDANALTLSFAPDNTPLGADKSKLFEAMKSTGKGDAWQLEALRAFQTWAAATNANVAVVADGGQAFGTSGDRQGDNRFGDIRIGATALSAQAVVLQRQLSQQDEPSPLRQREHEGALEQFPGRLGHASIRPGPTGARSARGVEP